MILSPEKMNSIPPCAIFVARFLAIMFGSIPDKPCDFVLIFILVVLAIEMLRNCHHFRRCRSTFSEVEHLTLDFSERNILTLGFSDNSGNQELFGFTPIVECVHASDFTTVSESPSGLL